MFFPVQVLFENKRKPLLIMQVKKSVGGLKEVDHTFLGQLFVQAIYTLQTHEMDSLMGCITDGGSFHFFKLKLPDSTTCLLDVMWVYSVNDMESAIGAISFCLTP